MSPSGDPGSKVRSHVRLAGLRFRCDMLLRIQYEHCARGGDLIASVGHRGDGTAHRALPPQGRIRKQLRACLI